MSQYNNDRENKANFQFELRVAATIATEANCPGQAQLLTVLSQALTKPVIDDLAKLYAQRIEILTKFLDQDPNKGPTHLQDSLAWLARQSTKKTPNVSISADFPQSTLEDLMPYQDLD